MLDTALTAERAAPPLAIDLDTLLPRLPLAARTVLRCLRQIRHGSIELHLPDGQLLRVGQGEAPHASLRIHAGYAQVDGEIVEGLRAQVGVRYEKQFPKIHLFTIDDTFGAQRVKLPAGDLVLYPGTSVHRVEPVTRGARIASFFWIESMVRSDEQRRLLFDMDRHLMHLRQTVGETDAGVIGLTGTYHNLLRRWAQT